MAEFQSKKEQSPEVLRFWLTSIEMHAPKAPFIIVGTRADKVSNHAQIDKALRRHCARLFDGAVRKFGSAFLEQKVELRWAHVLGDMLRIEPPRPFFTLQEVVLLAKEYDMGTSQMVDMLEFLHDIGMVLYFSKSLALAELVIVRPQWLIYQLTKVILDDDVEGQEQFAGRDSRLEAAGLDGDYEDMRFIGDASRRLLEFLWAGEPIQFLIDLMDNTLLLCKWMYAEEEAYLVPSIVPDNNEADAK